MDDLRYLIANEGNATAWLATVFAPPADEADHACAHAFARAFADRCGLDAVPEGLPEVHLEKDSIDLLLRWGPWAIVVEVKVRGASVRKGQLPDYYRKVRDRLGTGGPWRDATRVCMVFLTPDGVGADAFRELSVQGWDKRVHIGWSSVLDLAEARLGPGAGSPWRTLLQRGAARVRALLAELETRDEEDRPGQADCRAFASRVRVALRGSRPEGSLHVDHWSSGPDGFEEVYARLVRSGGPGSVYLTVFADSQLGPGSGGAGLLSARMYFWAAGRSNADNRAAFRSFQSPALPEAVAAMAEGAERVEIDWAARKVTVWIRRRGTLAELEAFAVAGMQAFLDAYAPLMTLGTDAAEGPSSAPGAAAAPSAPLEGPGGEGIAHERLLAELQELSARLERGGGDFGRWVAGPPSGEPGVIVMGHMEYGDAVEWFCRLADDAGLERPFDWLAWKEAEGRRYFEDDPTPIRTVDFPTLKKIVTVLLRSERFCEGSLLGAAESGMVSEIVRRWGELLAAGDTSAGS